MKALTELEKRRRKHLTIFSFATVLVLSFFTIYYGISHSYWFPVWFGILALVVMLVDAVKCRKNPAQTTGAGVSNCLGGDVNVKNVKKKTDYTKS